MKVFKESESLGKIASVNIGIYSHSKTFPGMKYSV